MNLEDLNKSQIIELMVECKRSFKTFCMVFFPHIFYIPFSGLHNQIFDFLDHEKNPRKVIKAPRGFGKSSILNLAYPARKLVFRECNFLIQAAKTARQAGKDSEGLKRELVTNDLIRKIFGSLKPEFKEGDWSKDQWITCPDNSGNPPHKGTLVLPTGWEQEIRGIKNGVFRPDLVIVDDLEGTEQVKTEEQREKIKHWFYGDLYNIMQRATMKAEGEFEWEMIVTGTLLHEAALIEELCKNKDWAVLELSLCDSQLNSNWEDFMTTAQVKELYQEYDNAGKLDQFAQEYLGEAQNKKTARFQADHFQLYSPSEVDLSAAQGIVLIDPAKTKEETSCDTAIVGYKYDSSIDQLYYVDCDAGRFDIDTTFRLACEMAERLSSPWARAKIGYETTGLDMYISYPLEMYMRLNGYMFEIIPLQAKGDKDDRIFSILPLIKTGKILFNPSVVAGIKLQLTSMPKSKKKDIADAASYINQIMNFGNKHFKFNMTKMLERAKERLEAATHHPSSQMRINRNLPRLRQRLPI